MKSGIYKIEHKESGKKYIGSAVNFAARWQGHKSHLRKNIHANAKLQNAWNKYGEDSFSFEPILHCEKEELIPYEQFCIDLYGVVVCGYNICPVAGNTTGVIPSDVTREKMRQKQLGRKHSAETRAKMSARLKGVPKTKEHIENFSNARKGKKIKPMSDKVKQMMVEIHRGKTIPDEMRKRISDKLKGRKLPPFSEETIKRMSDAAKAKIPSDLWKKKMKLIGKSKTFKYQFKKAVAK